MYTNFVLISRENKGGYRYQSRDNGQGLGRSRDHWEGILLYCLLSVPYISVVFKTAQDVVCLTTPHES